MAPSVVPSGNTEFLANTPSAFLTLLYVSLYEMVLAPRILLFGNRVTLVSATSMILEHCETSNGDHLYGSTQWLGSARYLLLRSREKDIIEGT